MPSDAPPGRPQAAVLIEEPDSIAGLKSSIITMINSAIGAGILSLPYAFRCTGWAAGCAAILLLGAVEAYTAFVLCRFAEHTGSKTYGALVHRMLGRRASLAVSLITLFFLFFACCAFLIVIGDTFNPLLSEAFGEAWWTTRRAAIAAVGCACVLPLTFRRSLGALRGTPPVSSLAVAAIMVVVGAVVFSSLRILASPQHSEEGLRAFNPSLQFFGALPLIIFSFSCHTNVIAVFGELAPGVPSALPVSSPVALPAGKPRQEDGEACPGLESLPSPLLLASRSQRRLKSGKLRRMALVITVALTLTALLYMLVGLAGYLAFPLDTRSDILLNFSCADPLMQVARACIGLVITASYPVIHFPARAAARELLQHASGRCLAGRVFEAAESLVFFSGTAAIALWSRDLGAMFQLVGGTCGGVLILSVPGACLIRHSLNKHSACRQQLAELQEPLLALQEAGAPDGGGDGGGSGSGGAGDGATAAVRQQRPAFSWWASRLFWTGALLQLLAAAVAVLTVLTVAGVLPSP